MRMFGIERERFIVDAQGNIVSEIGRLLPRVHQTAVGLGISEERFTYELFAGQAEDRTPPCRSVDGVRDMLTANDAVLIKAATEFELSFEHSELVEERRIVSLVANPFDERHQKIWESISHERRVAASIVAAIHVHISVNKDEVVWILNQCRGEVLERLISIGDHSKLRRIAKYRNMAQSDGVPPEFSNLEDVMGYIKSKGGEKNVWDLVRFKPSTHTIEFRMFGATANIEEIIQYVNVCHDIFES